MFREHWIGGLVAYSTFFIVSFIATIAVSIFYAVPAAWNPTISLNPLKVVGCFAIAVLFGLWPDVDIKSKSQKIFYTLLFVLNVVLIVFWRKYLESALLGLFAMLPILSKHRGWTHARVTMVLLPGLFLLVPIYAAHPEWYSGGTFLDAFNALLEWEELSVIILTGLPFYVASFIGYASHLYLDGILFRSRKAQRQQARASQ
jgi:flagellar biosynthesis protein FliQ